MQALSPQIKGPGRGKRVNINYNMTYIYSMKVSSKQNTLMKWFSKSPKKDTPRKVQASDKDDGNDEMPNKKPKLES